MSKNGVWVCIFWAFLSSLWGCSATGEDKPQKDKSISPSAKAVEVMQVKPTDMEQAIEVTGNLTAKYATDVKSEYTGLVAEVYVHEWVRVEKGTPLARLDTREAELLLQKAKAAVQIAKANLLQAEVGARRANREYERALKLKEFGLITQQNLDDALTEKEAAAVRVEAARGQLQAAEEDERHMQTRLAKAIIRSPRAGVISWRNVNVGDYVGEMGAKPMFRIVDTSLLELTVSVPSAEMAAVRLGQTLIFTSDAFPGKVFQGKVMFINPVINEADRSVKVIAEVDNSSQILKPGLFVKGKIIIAQRRGLIMIPRSALLTWEIMEKKGEVFVVQDNVVKRQTIKTGNPAGSLIEVTSGLKAGDRVIIRGGFQVQEGEQVKITNIAGES